MKSVKQIKARFDTRLSIEQKLLFERAAMLGGFRNLTDFIIHTAQDRANEIIMKNEEIISSERDSELFFDAIVNPAPPNKSLMNAVANYNKTIKAK